MSQDSGTISGVRSVGISIGTATTSGNYGFWTVSASDRLLLALEEAVDHKAGEPRHGKAGDAKQNKEEDLKCKYGHDAILTR
jgi:hypothetical protein